MPKLPKFPKQPKAGSSLAVWERYEQRCKDVAAKRKAIKEAPKKKDAIRSRVSSLKSKS